MKAKKTSVSDKQRKKQIKSDLEVNLKSKLSDFVKSLGHDANDIGAEIKKMSKLLAKKLSRKVKSVKSITEFKKESKGEPQKSKAVKKETVKSPEKVKKVIAKATKKSGEKPVTIEEIVKKEIINPAKVVLDSKDENDIMPVSTVKKTPQKTTSNTSTKKASAANTTSAKSQANKKPAAKNTVPAAGKDSKNNSNITKPRTVKSNSKEPKN